MRQFISNFKKFIISSTLFVSISLSLFLHLIAVYTIYFFSTPDYSIPITCGIEQTTKSEKIQTALNFEFSNKKKGNQKQTDSNEKGDYNSDIYNQLSDYEKKKWKKLLKGLEKTKGLRKNFLEDFTNIMNSDTPQSYIRRNRDYEDIIVKETIPTLKNINQPFEETIKNAPKELEEHQERNKIIQKFRNQEKSEHYNSIISLNSEFKKSSFKPVLKLSKTERQKYLDKTITLQKEEIFENFKNKFMFYDPNEGDLPIFVRELYYENLQRLAYFFSSDETYFSIDYLQEALNKEDFLKNAMSYLSELKGTKAATEFLFIVENIYEIQQRTIKIYFENKKRVQNLPEKANNQIRIETLKRVISKYQQILKEKKIKNFQDASQLYEKKRIEILKYLIRTTPDNYRLADALFVQAEIFWKKYMKSRNSKFKQKAISNWKKINDIKSKDNFINQATFEKMKPLMDFVNADLSDIEFEISNILDENLTTQTEKKRKREEKLLWK